MAFGLCGLKTTRTAGDSRHYQRADVPVALIPAGEEMRDVAVHHCVRLLEVMGTHGSDNSQIDRGVRTAISQIRIVLSKV